MQMLNESEAINGLMASSKFGPLSENQKSTMQLLLKNAFHEQAALNEGTDTGAIAQFTPILMPLVRRVYPQLIANHILGVQPMTMPTGYIYALTNHYIGDGNTHANPNHKGLIIEAASAEHGLKVGDTVFTDGKVLYVEGAKVLISYDTAAKTATELYHVPSIGDAFGTSTVKGVFTNEAAFHRILKNYTGPMTTAQAELKGRDMTEIGFSVSKKSIEAKARNLKGRYTVEMYQDLQAQHGLLADEEIMSLLSYEMQAEIDRDVVDFVNANATQLPDTQFPVITSGQGDGRWEIERYRVQAIRISNEAAMIGVDTKRGQGNVLIVSPKVCSMLREVGKFQTAPVGTTSLDTPVVGGVAGVFDDRFKVVVDQYAKNDYCTVLYKGEDRRDAMGFFAPYVPLTFTNTVDAESGQPAIIAKVRYGLATIPGIVSPEANDRAMSYARSFGIDFANTVLGGGAYNWGQIGK